MPWRDIPASERLKPCLFFPAGKILAMAKLVGTTNILSGARVVYVTTSSIKDTSHRNMFPSDFLNMLWPCGFHTRKWAYTSLPLPIKDCTCPKSRSPSMVKRTKVIGRSKGTKRVSAIETILHMVTSLQAQSQLDSMCQSWISINWFHNALFG